MVERISNRLQLAELGSNPTSALLLLPNLVALSESQFPSVKQWITYNDRDL